MKGTEPASNPMPVRLCLLLVLSARFMKYSPNCNAYFNKVTLINLLCSWQSPQENQQFVVLSVSRQKYSPYETIAH